MSHRVLGRRPTGWAATSYETADWNLVGPTEHGFRCIADLIGRRFGGTITRHDVYDMWIATTR